MIHERIVQVLKTDNEIGTLQLLELAVKHGYDVMAFFPEIDKLTDNQISLYASILHLKLLLLIQKG